MSLISKQERDEIEDLCLKAGLSNPQYRSRLLDGIDPGATGLISYPNPPFLQLQIDLAWVADKERIADGTIPLLVWLKNAFHLTRALAEGQEFRRWADIVSARAGGEPVLAVARKTADSPLVISLDGTTPILEIKESILFGTSEIIPFGFLEAGADIGKSVVQLAVPIYQDGVPETANGKQVFRGTGWVLGPNHIITNHHVINARKQGALPARPEDFLRQGAEVEIRFDYDDESLSGQKFLSKRVVAWDEKLDYAVLETRDSHHRPPLPRTQSKLVKNNDHIPVNIIQHPDGGPKMIAIRNNLVTSATKDDLSYLTDTKFGSSGAPVLNDQWIVVALHRGSVVAEGVKYFGSSTVYVNVGTQIASIEEHLKTNFTDVWGAIRAA